MSDEQRDEHNTPADAKDLLRWAERTQLTIDFIVQQQAQFQAKTEADMQQLRELQARAEERAARADERAARADERMARADERMARAHDKWERTAEGITALLAIAEMHEREIFELREAQERTGAQMSETDRRMAETDERLNALINTVERIISERRNGGRKEPGGADE
ncbi:MAG TPA: hypothetical protein VK422_14780 [Pyrinomonadaceae bacterium]|nr:hypothetical protein [Pyrinomonadaceae bacterium]